MLSLFRNLIKSKVGAALALLLLGLIALAFAGGDIAGFNSSGGLGSGNAVAAVDGEDIDANELSRAANTRLEMFKQQNPSATMKLLVEQGGLDLIVEDLIDRTAIDVFGRKHGIVAGNRLIDSEIAQEDAFHGLDGKFDEATYRQALQRLGLSEALMRQDISQGLVGQQMIVPAQFGTKVPEYMVGRYATLLDETRKGSVLALPSLLFQPTEKPDDAALAAFYKANTNLFIRPERRVVRYATFGPESIKAPAPATDAEIAALYKASASKYAAQDDRKITQLIVPTQDAAKAIVNEVSGGKSLEAAAQSKGLKAAALEFFNREQLTSQFSKPVADAVFGAQVGAMAAPARSALGWHVIRVDEEKKTPARSVTEVRDELAQQVDADKRRAAFTAILESLDNQIDEGASLPEMAKSLGAEIKTTGPVTAEGRVYGKVGESVDEGLQPLLKTAFAMDQEEPQVTQMSEGVDFSAGRPFVIYDVTEITASAPAPFKEIREDVETRWLRDKGSAAAKASAQKVIDAMAKGKTMEQAVAALGKKLPPIQRVAMNRQMLQQAQQQGRQIPPPITLLFRMAKNSVKLQFVGSERGWFVVKLDDIETPGKPSDAAVAQARRLLAQPLGSDYVDAFAGAIRKESKVTKNAAAIKSVGNQLAGTASSN